MTSIYMQCRALIVGSMAPVGNAFRASCVESSTLPWAPAEVRATRVTRMIRNASLQLTLLHLVLFTGSIARAQAPAGPLPPQPGAALQQPPPQSKLKAQVTLVDMPVTVRNAKGEMVHTLEVQNF